MFEFFDSGDFFKSKCQTIVNPVNCVGVMGAGLALEFKKRYPEMYQDYRSKCAQGKIKLGLPYLFKQDDSLQILNFATKNHYRQKSDLKGIHSGLVFIRENYKEFEITSLAIPQLGCGLGGLNWEREVYPLFKKELESLDIPVHIYINSS